MATASPLMPSFIHRTSVALSFNTNGSPTKASIGVPRGPVSTRLSFYDPPADGSKPFNYAGAYADNPPAGQPPRNFGEAWQNVQIQDIRGREEEFNLDDNAFAVLRDQAQSKEKEWVDDESIKASYYPEVEKLLLENVPGAKRVLLFDHTIRRPNASRAPVQRVHIDQTPSSAEARVRHHLPEEAGDLLKGRYRIINVWRPLNGPVVSFPLAVADSATVEDTDLVGVEHRYPDRTGETAAVRYNPKQTWYYWSAMTNDERLLLKCFDSDEEVGKYGRVPHTAFDDPRTQPHWPGRESIEVRALVFG